MSLLQEAESWPEVLKLKEILHEAPLAALVHVLRIVSAELTERVGGK